MSSSSQQLEASLDDYEALQSRGILIKKKIGSGAFCTVHLVETRFMNGEKRLLACKIFNQSKASKDYLGKFLPRELAILMKLSHPFIVTLDRILQKGPKVYILMYYAAMGDLFTWIETNGVTPEPLAHRWYHQMVSAFQYLHGMNIAHRDLKCENILISGNYNVKVADFGFARFCVNSLGQRELSRTYCGSAAYAAPEIVAQQPYNPKMADIWSMGVVLYIMATAAMPFEDENLPLLYRRQMQKKWTLDEKYRKGLSPALKHLIGRILEPDVTRRIDLNGMARHSWLRQEFPLGEGDKRNSFT